MIEIKTGTVEGTGSAINITCGFIPKYVKLINIDGDATGEWTEDMTDDEIFKDLPTGVMAQMASGGITPMTVNGTVLGFTIGTDTDINVSAETLMWIAMR